MNIIVIFLSRCWSKKLFIAYIVFGNDLLVFSIFYQYWYRFVQHIHFWRVPKARFTVKFCDYHINMVISFLYSTFTFEELLEIYEPRFYCSALIVPLIEMRRYCTIQLNELQGYDSVDVIPFNWTISSCSFQLNKPQLYHSAERVPSVRFIRCCTVHLNDQFL